MKITFIVLFTFCTCLTNAQNKIEWTSDYKLKLEDFQSTETEIGAKIVAVKSSAGIDFSFQMTMMEFMFTKNFNTKVSCSFTKDLALVVAPDTDIAQKLVNFAQYEFDLSELYARKLRKRLFESKGTFSDPNFFKVIYDEIQKEYTEKSSMVGKATELGRKDEVLKVFQQEVVLEIENYKEYCKACKPKKKKK